MTFIPLTWALYGAITLSAISLTAGFFIGRRCRYCQQKQTQARDYYVPPINGNGGDQ